MPSVNLDCTNANVLVQIGNVRACTIFMEANFVRLESIEKDIKY